MKRITLYASVLLTAICAPSLAQPQTGSSTSSKLSLVPSLVKFTGTARDFDGNPLSGVLGISFALYESDRGGSSLWRETQNVTVDKSGHYSVSLGATEVEGLPTELFTSGQARWLGVQIEGHSEGPRVLLVSVPYALKAADAETIGGLPPSAFVLATPGGTASLSPAVGDNAANASNSALAGAAPTGSGTTNFVPRWTGSSTLGNSSLFQLGTGTAAKLGINTTSPATALDVLGAGTIRGALALPATTTATAILGASSQPLNLSASSFSSSTKAASNQSFQWKAEPWANNTATPSGTLNLLFSSGASNPAETGFKIANNGLLTFVNGQTFPGAGTITGVAAGTDLTGGGTSGKITLNLNTTAIDARYARLGAANTYSQEQQIIGTTVGLNSYASAAGGIGVQGFGSGAGVEGMSSAANGIGILGYGNGTKGIGVSGSSNGQNGVGVSGTSTAGGTGVSGTTFGGTAVKGQDSGAGIGVEGVSTSGYGVYGFSSTSHGVDGYTSHGTGVNGVSGGDTLNTAGVYGRAGNGTTFGGIAGVWGEADQHVGVFGSSTAYSGVLGESQNGYGVQAISNGADGVNGTSHTINGSGVAGINDAAGGIGVYGHSSNGGFGVYTDSNAAQSRGMGGWAKAMVFVDPFTSNGTAITRCYNSQASGATVWTPPCGIGIVHDGQGEDTLDFGFQVSDRYISTASFSGSIGACVQDAHNFCPFSASQVHTFTNNYLGNKTDAAFWVIIF
jgi:hypothetical protein